MMVRLLPGKYAGIVIGENPAVPSRDFFIPNRIHTNPIGKTSSKSYYAARGKMKW
jgi:hypothetical protein